LKGQSGQGEGGRGRLCRKTLKPKRSSRSDPSVFFVGEDHDRKILPSRDQARKSVTAAGFVLDGATGGPLIPQPEKASGRSRRVKKMVGTIRFKGRFSDDLVYIYRNISKFGNPQIRIKV
jgi:hypothetical protein